MLKKLWPWNTRERAKLSNDAAKSLEEAGVIPYSFYEFDYWTIEAMRKKGGSFVKALAEAASRADRFNLQKLKDCWSEYWEQYEDEGQKLRFEACPEGMCDGSGEVASDESDGEGNIMRGVGTQACLCRAK